MPFGPTAPSPLDPRRPARRDPGRAATRPRALLRVEPLESRQLFAVTSPSVVMTSATTLDSKGVTITYDVTSPRTTPITLGVYRSADTNLSDDDPAVQGVVALPAVDSSGASTTSVGTHTVTVPIPGGLPLNPQHPYVLAVANPIASEAGDVPSTASFRKYTIGVITHGGIQHTAWIKNGPPWILKMGKSMLAEGYDAVIPWNWVGASNTPGSAAKQGPKLAAKVLATSSTFPTDSPVDIQFIGHSEGAVVNTQAIVAVAAKQTPQLQKGFWQDTLLDPHAANPDFAGRQYSVGGLFAPIAKMTIDNYQSRARDPIVYVPDRIDQSEVFYQQTPAYHDHGQNDGVYNLWGQVPVRNAEVYYNLTPSGIVHGGNNGMYNWYQYFVVPQLGDGAPLLDRSRLTGTMVTTTTSQAAPPASASTVAAPGATPVAAASDPAHPEFRGSAMPGATVVIRVGRPGTNQLRPVASTVAGADGTWDATIDQDLAAGNYRVVASSRIHNIITGKRPVVAMQPLGSFVVNPTYRR